MPNFLCICNAQTAAEISHLLEPLCCRDIADVSDLAEMSVTQLLGLRGP